MNSKTDPLEAVLNSIPTLNRLPSRIKQLKLSLNNIQYELDTLNTILNAIEEDLKTGES